MNILKSLEIDQWTAVFPEAVQTLALNLLESGQVLFLPRLKCEIQAHERGLLDPACLNGKAKNIKFDPLTDRVGGTSLHGEPDRNLHRMIHRFSTSVEGLPKNLFVRYASKLQRGRTSFRPFEACGRSPGSRRKEDRLLHADAFPTQGRRILRVFSNVNPVGALRFWPVGEQFED